jgi:hypothetical protein
VVFGVREELTPPDTGSDVALTDVSMNCEQKIAGNKEQRSNNQLSTAEGSGVLSV